MAFWELLSQEKEFGKKAGSVGSDFHPADGQFTLKLPQKGGPERSVVHRQRLSSGTAAVWFVRYLFLVCWHLPVVQLLRSLPGRSLGQNPISTKKDAVPPSLPQVRLCAFGKHVLGTLIDNAPFPPRFERLTLLSSLYLEIV